MKRGGGGKDIKYNWKSTKTGVWHVWPHLRTWGHGGSGQNGIVEHEVGTGEPYVGDLDCKRSGFCIGLLGQECSEGCERLDTWQDRSYLRKIGSRKAWEARKEGKSIGLARVEYYDEDGALKMADLVGYTGEYTGELNWEDWRNLKILNEGVDKSLLRFLWRVKGTLNRGEANLLSSSWRKDKDFINDEDSVRRYKERGELKAWYAGLISGGRFKRESGRLVYRNKIRNKAVAERAGLKLNYKTTSKKKLRAISEVLINDSKSELDTARGEEVLAYLKNEIGLDEMRLENGGVSELCQTGVVGWLESRVNYLEENVIVNGVKKELHEVSKRVLGVKSFVKKSKRRGDDYIRIRNMAQQYKYLEYVKDYVRDVGSVANWEWSVKSKYLLQGEEELSDYYREVTGKETWAFVDDFLRKDWKWKPVD